MADKKNTTTAAETTETAQGAAANPETSETATAATETAAATTKAATAKKATTPKAADSTSETKTTPKTAAKSLETIGKNILATNSKHSEVYVISNGRAFFNQADAANAARCLGNKTVTTVKR